MSTPTFYKGRAAELARDAIQSRHWSMSALGPQHRDDAWRVSVMLFAMARTEVGK